jgi:hypothetical protein
LIVYSDFLVRACGLGLHPEARRRRPIHNEEEKRGKDGTVSMSGIVYKKIII